MAVQLAHWLARPPLLGIDLPCAHHLLCWAHVRLLARSLGPLSRFFLLQPQPGAGPSVLREAWVLGQGPTPSFSLFFFGTYLSAPWDLFSCGVLSPHHA